MGPAAPGGSRLITYRYMNAEKPRILAITLNWRQPEITLACVHALQAMNYPHLEILVIDNGSGGKSVDYLQVNLPPEVHLHALSENVGFAAGNNVGLRQALERQFDLALMINNDAFASPNMLAHLLSEFSPDIGLLSPKIYYAERRDLIWFAGGRRHPATLDLQQSGRGQPDGPAWQYSRDVDYLLGTCLLVNLRALSQVGLLDDCFFMYFEDLDWSLRFRQAGYRLRLVATAYLYHQVAVSSGGLETPARQYHLARSGVIFWRRHVRLGKPANIFLLRLGSALKTTGRLLAKGNIASLQAYWRGIRDGLCYGR
jgi:GT2 family glycosyltransferase